MEEIIVLVLTLIFIIQPIISNSRKKKAEAARMANKQDLPDTEEDNEVVAEYLTDTNDSSFDRMSPVSERPNLVAQEETSSVMSVVNADESDEHETDIMDGFDINRAIIYSEIIKPKFND